MKNRLGIYFFYDEKGIVDNYVTYYLQKLKPFCSELCIVVNGKLNTEGQDKLKKYANKLIIRENKGFDSWAYKEAIESYGYENIKKYDELLLSNFTCYGPVFPFSEMFNKMNKRQELDFWGISWYPERKGIRYSLLQEGPDLLKHIQFFFNIIRNRVLSSHDFESYWRSLKMPQSYVDAVAVHEMRFTKYLQDRGFKVGTFIPEEVTNKFKENSPTYSPINIIKERCPLVKRRAFYTDYDRFIYHGRGDQPYNIFKYIMENTTYNTDLIWDNLLRTQKGSTLKRNLHLNYFLDENNYLGDEKMLKNNLKVAMLCYCYYPDMVEYCYNYAKNLPSWVDIYVFVVDKNTADEFINKFSVLPNNIEVRIKENRGQLASTILISGKDIFEKYDLVCVTQAKKTSQLRDQFASENYCEHCWQGVLKSPAYVLNLIQAYYDNPRMGYSCNFIPHWQAFLNLPTNELTTNKTLMEKLFKNFSLNIPFDDEPIASYGECYWVRSKGYKKILAHNWKHSDFPEASQTPKDGSILNALERMMPLFVQDMGFYASWIIPMSYASIYFDNIYHLYRLEKLKTKQSLSISNKADIQIYKDVFHFNNLLLKYWVSKILYKLCIGNYRRKNKQKSNKYKNRIKAVKSLRKRVLENI